MDIITCTATITRESLVSLLVIMYTCPLNTLCKQLGYFIFITLPLIVNLFEPEK